MLVGIALILIGFYVAMPQSISIVLYVFGAIEIASSLCDITIKFKDKD